jgi:plastocyanin
MRLRLAAALIALLVLAPGTNAADQQITAQNNSAQFSPNEVTVNVGEKVTVTRPAGGTFAHNVHYDDETNPCPGPPTTSDWTCPRTFTTAGNYTFHCDLHTSMTGTVHVVAPTSTTPGPGPTPTTPTSPGDVAAPAPKAVPLGQIARIPKGCAPRRSFRIRLRHPDELSAARIFVNGKRVAAPKGEKLASRVKVRPLPKGRFTLKVEVTRTDGSRLVGKRRLRTCT